MEVKIIYLKNKKQYYVEIRKRDTNFYKIELKRNKCKIKNEKIKL